MINCSLIVSYYLFITLLDQFAFYFIVEDNVKTDLQ